MKVAKLTALATIVAVALSVAPQSFSGDEIVSLQPERQGQVSFVSGGVGDDEAQAIKSMAANYPVEMLFVAKGNPNQYLANVKVLITDRTGNVVLDTTTRGPFLFAKLPPGRYSVSAEAEGGVKKQNIQVTGARQRVMLLWDRGGGETAGVGYR
ncbi:MAG TPA: carboxypeptidase-like regulatory domain-containing protein [Burkholderiales bacterium]|nr:carboxypeptidase-like regulatory domain-containing protein [Burkholderiales bacterium]